MDGPFGGLTFEGMTDWVLTVPAETTGKSFGGVLLPDNAHPRPTVVRVVALGPKADLEGVVPGDLVAVPEYGVQICDPLGNGEEMRCYPADKVLGKVIDGKMPT